MLEETVKSAILSLNNAVDEICKLENTLKKKIIYVTNSEIDNYYKNNEKLKTNIKSYIDIIHLIEANNN